MKMDRRTFTKTLAAAAGALALPSWPTWSTDAAAAKLPVNRVTKIRCYYPPNYQANGPQAFPQSNMVVLVDTEAGITGIGQGGSPDTVRNMARSVIGKNAFDTEFIWQHGFMDGFYSPGKERLHALGAIDVALWDIKGKALETPLYELFGGKARQHIELYATNGVPPGLIPQNELQRMSLKDRAAATMAAGYRVYRVDSSIAPTPAGGVAGPRGGGARGANAATTPIGVTGSRGTFNSRSRIREIGEAAAQIREGIGPDGDWMIDLHQSFDLHEAVEVCNVIAPSRPFCAEDPLREEQFRTQIPKLRLMTSIPLAAGEEWGTRADFSTLVEQRDIDFARASLPNVGGITEMLKIMAMCDLHKVGIVPHFTGPIATVAHMHTMMAFPGQVLMEYNQHDRPVPYLPNFLDFRNGKVWPNDRPGLGVSVDEKQLTFIEAMTEGAPARHICVRTDRPHTGETSVTWQQVYDPFGNKLLSTAVSALPVLTLFFVLVGLKKRVWMAALSGLIMAVALALLVFKMPAVLVTTAAGHGFIFGLLRIAWIVVGSIFLYNVASETGQFQIMKDSIAGLSSDKRLQLVLIAFCFGAFLEGTGGGGAPVAIAGAFLMGLGFSPFQSATLCLLANTAPVAWGGVGNPIRTLGGVTGLPEAQFSAMAGRVLPPLSLILPFWLVRSMVGWRETFQVWPALLVSGLSFAGMQFYWSNYQDIGLVDVVAAVFSLLMTMAFLKFWKPRTLIPVSELMVSPKRHSAAQVLKGWSPFIVASVLIFVTGLPSIAKYLNFDALRMPMPYLHNAVLKMPPIAPKPSPEDATVNLNFVGIPGTVVFVAGLVAALLARLPSRKIVRLFKSTVVQMTPSLLAISFMVGLAYVTRYCGMDTIMGLSLTGTGRLYPFFGTLLGWLGVALTGTDAGSNALFGNLQKVTAEQLSLSPILMGAANSTGGVMGKMIDAQSIVVSSSATNQQGNEAAIFKAVFWHSIALASIVAAIVMFYAYVVPWAIPR